MKYYTGIFPINQEKQDSNIIHSCMFKNTSASNNIIHQKAPLARNNIFSLQTAKKKSSINPPIFSTVSDPSSSYHEKPSIKNLFIDFLYSLANISGLFILMIIRDLRLLVLISVYFVRNFGCVFNVCFPSAFGTLHFTEFYHFTIYQTSIQRKKTWNTIKALGILIFFHNFSRKKKIVGENCGRFFFFFQLKTVYWSKCWIMSTAKIIDKDTWTKCFRCEWKSQEKNKRKRNIFFACHKCVILYNLVLFYVFYMLQAFMFHRSHVLW